MNLKYLIFSTLYFAFSTINAKAQPCEYANSNINYVKTQTQRALDAKEISKVRFFAYRAINTIEKTKGKLKSCDCNYAADSILEGLEQLKSATRATSLDSTKIFLQRAIENTNHGLDALKKHDLHAQTYTNELLSLNTVSSRREKRALKLPEDNILKAKIDQSLIDVKNSLDEVVNTVDCKAAYDFAYTIYRKSEKELKNDNLSEAKRYYNVKTKSIASNAIKKLEDCIR